MYSKLIAAMLTLLVCMGINTGHAAGQEQINRQQHPESTKTEEAAEQIPTAAAHRKISVRHTADTISATDVTSFADPERPADWLAEDEARAAALAYADLPAEDVTFFRTEPDYERGMPVWDVEFRAGDWEYDYAVHAETGEIVKQDRDYEPRRQTAGKPKITDTAEPAVTPTPVPQVEASSGENLTSDAAEDIALAHAGLSRTVVRGLRTELDRDDGRPVYEIEFRDGAVEYEYEIHAQTGAVLGWDRDYDD